MTAETSHRGGRITISTTQRKLRVPRKQMADLIGFIAEAERRPIDHVDVAVVGGKRMASLNRQYLRHAGATDVISFDLGSGPTGGLCAQLIVCSDVATAEARTRGHDNRRELLLYVAHGLLHAMGYLDDTPDRAARMHRRENELLETFGIGAVYGKV